MTSPRSMLKVLAAACLGGWWGLGRKAAAGAIIITPSPVPAEPIECTYGSATSAGPELWAYACSYRYDAEGRLIWAKDGDGEVTSYEYPGSC